MSFHESPEVILVEEGYGIIRAQGGNGEMNC